MDKPGWKTTEFWVTSLASAAKVAIALFAFAEAHKGDLQSAVSSTSLAISTIWALALGAKTYVNSRTAVKSSLAAQLVAAVTKTAAVLLILLIPSLASAQV